MASANWAKATTQKAGAMKKHLNQNARESCNHSNKDIDKSLTHLNYALGCKDYSEALNSMKARTAENESKYKQRALTAEKQVKEQGATIKNLQAQVDKYKPKLTLSREQLNESQKIIDKKYDAKKYREYIEATGQTEAFNEWEHGKSTSRNNYRS